MRSMQSSSGAIMAHRLAAAAFAPPLAALWRGRCRRGFQELALTRQCFKRANPGCIVSLHHWLCSKPPEGLGPPKNAGGSSGGGSKKGRKEEDSGWWRRMQKGEFPWDNKDFRYLAVMGVGVISGFLFFYSGPG